MRKERMVFTALTATVLFFLLSSACTKKTSDSDFVLNVSYVGSLCESPIHIAYEKGFFKEEGLNVELTKITASGAEFELITAGKIDASFGLAATIIPPLVNGLPVKITTGIHTGCVVGLVNPDSGINKVTDLRGKQIGVPNLAGGMTNHTKRVLADSGIDIRTESSEVEFIVYSTSDLPLVLSQGRLDAIIMSEPTATIAKSQYGFKTVFEQALDEEYKDEICCIAYVSNRLLEKHKDIAVKFTRAMQKASAYVQDNPEETARLQVEKKYAPGDPVVNGEVLKKLNYRPSVNGGYEVLNTVTKNLKEIGMISSDINIDAFIKNSFVFLDGLDPEYK